MALKGGHQGLISKPFKNTCYSSAYGIKTTRITPPYPPPEYTLRYHFASPAGPLNLHTGSKKYTFRIWGLFDPRELSVVIYCCVPARWGLQQTTRAPGSDKTRGQGSFGPFTGGQNLTVVCQIR